MKRFLLATFLVFNFINYFAQMWCYPGAEWHYTRNYYTGKGYVRHTYMGNEVFQDKNCQKLLYYSEEYNYLSQAIQTFTVNYHTYVENDLVYIYNIDQAEFDTLINYAANPGDVWYYPNISPDDCNYIRCLVQDTGHHLVEGQYLKWFKVNHTDTIYERIGNLQLYTYRQTAGCQIYSDFAYGGALRCYKDNQIHNFKKYSKVCDYYDIPNNLSENVFENVVLLYPNPTKDKITIEYINETDFIKPKEIKIKDVLGKEVKLVLLQSKKQVISLEELSKGCYFIQLNTADGFKITKKIVKE